MTRKRLPRFSGLSRQWCREGREAQRWQGVCPQPHSGWCSTANLGQGPRTSAPRPRSLHYKVTPLFNSQNQDLLLSLQLPVANSISFFRINHLY